MISALNGPSIPLMPTSTALFLTPMQRAYYLHIRTCIANRTESKVIAVKPAAIQNPSPEAWKDLLIAVEHLVYEEKAVLQFARAADDDSLLLQISPDDQYDPALPPKTDWYSIARPAQRLSHLAPEAVACTPSITIPQLHYLAHIQSLMAANKEGNKVFSIEATKLPTYSPSPAQDIRWAIEYLAYDDKSIAAYAFVDTSTFLIFLKAGDQIDASLDQIRRTEWYSPSRPAERIGYASPVVSTPFTPAELQLLAHVRARIASQQNGLALLVDVNASGIQSPSPTRDVRKVVEFLAYDEKSIAAYAFGADDSKFLILAKTGDQIEPSLDNTRRGDWFSPTKPAERVTQQWVDEKVTQQLVKEPLSKHLEEENATQPLTEATVPQQPSISTIPAHVTPALEVPKATLTPVAKESERPRSVPPARKTQVSHPLVSREPSLPKSSPSTHVTTIPKATLKPEAKEPAARSRSVPPVRKDPSIDQKRDMSPPRAPATAPEKPILSPSLIQSPPATYFPSSTPSVISDFPQSLADLIPLSPEEMDAWKQLSPSIEEARRNNQTLEFAATPSLPPASLYKICDRCFLTRQIEAWGTSKNGVVIMPTSSASKSPSLRTMETFLKKQGEQVAQFLIDRGLVQEEQQKIYLRKILTEMIKKKKIGIVMADFFPFKDNNDPSLQAVLDIFLRLKLCLGWKFIFGGSDAVVKISPDDVMPPDRKDAEFPKTITYRTLEIVESEAKFKKEHILKIPSDIASSLNKAQSYILEEFVKKANARLEHCPVRILISDDADTVFNLLKSKGLIYDFCREISRASWKLPQISVFIKKEDFDLIL